MPTIQRRAADLSEANPMLGHRGCRLGITYPEIYEMQAQAIFEAAIAVAEETGAAPVPEIMIPLVSPPRELEITRALVANVAEQVFAASGRTIVYQVGTMIELPRAALLADKIAEIGDFFSFGTNDLTQTTYGLSRDDAGKFLPKYVESGIFEKDPFVSLDRDGVGLLVRIAAEKGRSRSRISSSASAASMAATRPPSLSARRLASITSPAAPTGCRSRAWPRPRRPSETGQTRRPDCLNGNKNSHLLTISWVLASVIGGVGRQRTLPTPTLVRQGAAGYE